MNRVRAEWPTWLLMGAIYGGWLLLLLFSGAMPLWVLSPLGAWLICWHSSLQHEVIHGHPSRVRWLNSLIGFIPLGIAVPFFLYKESHLRHHRTSNLTDPQKDPESFYVEPARWQQMARWKRVLLTCNQTLSGRLLLGPWISACRLYRLEYHNLAKNPSRLTAWIAHGLACGLVLAWVQSVCGLPVWKYLLFIVYPGLSLTTLRSFVEHRPGQGRKQSSAIVESNWFFGLLFLFNNLHAVHHRHPALPWYRIPKYYRTNRRLILQQNGGYFFSGYWSLLGRYALSPKDKPEHTALNPARTGLCRSRH